MASQFLHLSGVGLTASHRHPAWHNVGDILAEAARAPGSTGHITRPRMPLLLHGLPPQEIEASVRTLADQAVDAKGRRIRRDAIVMYSIVASYPVKCSDLSAADRAEYLSWRQATLDWLNRCFGEQMMSAVEHLDESHPHIHVFVVPNLTGSGQIDHSRHPGYAARMIARSNSANRKEAERGYRAGMRDFQDAYERNVSSQFGHARIGPRRRRLRRDAVLARRSAALAAGALAELTHRLSDTLSRFETVLAADLEPAQLKLLAFACQEIEEQLQAGRPPDIARLEAFLVHPDNDGAPSDTGWDEDPHGENDDIGPDEFAVEYDDVQFDEDIGADEEFEDQRDLDEFAADAVDPDDPALESGEQ